MALQQVAPRLVCHLFFEAVALAVMMSTPSTAAPGSVSAFSQRPSVATAPGSVPDLALAAEPIIDEACRRFVDQGFTVQSTLLSWPFFLVMLNVGFIVCGSAGLTIAGMRWTVGTGTQGIEALINLGHDEPAPEWWPASLQCRASDGRVRHYLRRGLAVKVASEVNAALDLLRSAVFAWLGLVLCTEATISWLKVYLHLSTEYDCGWVQRILFIGEGIWYSGFIACFFSTTLAIFVFKHGHKWQLLARVQSGAMRVIAKKEAKRKAEKEAVMRDASGESNGVEPAGLHLPQLSSEEEDSLLVGKRAELSGPFGTDFDEVDLDEKTARPSTPSNREDKVSKLIPYTLQAGLVLVVLELVFDSNAMDQGFAGNMLALAAPALVAVLGYFVGYLLSGSWAGALVVKRYSLACQRSSYHDKRWLDEVGDVRLSEYVVAEPEGLSRLPLLRSSTIRQANHFRLLS